MTVFVDTSAWYAAADVSDVHHRRAVERLSEFSGDLLTSDHVLVETWFLAANRLGTEVAETLANAIRAGRARVEVAGVADLEIAAQIHDTFADQEFSIRRSHELVDHATARRARGDLVRPGLPDLPVRPRPPRGLHRSHIAHPTIDLEPHSSPRIERSKNAGTSPPRLPALPEDALVLHAGVFQ